MHPYEGKKILITGASKGLGYVASRAFAEVGARVILCARSTDKLNACRDELPQPEKHVVLEADFRDVSSIEKKLRTVLDQVNGIDVVLHCAGGGFGMKRPLLEPAELSTLFAVNVAAAVEINRIVVPYMRERGRGNLVHIGSIASYEGVGSVGYNTVKAALNAYVRSLGRELAEDGIIVTGISPGGFIAKENAMERLRSQNPSAYDEFIQSRLPRRMMPNAEELVPMLLLLCGPQAGMFCGCMVPMDAGEGKFYGP